MAKSGESSSATLKDKNEKPVIVRVKRKATQSRVEAFWLEINSRPLKRPLLDFGKLSITESSAKEELETEKVLVQHQETVSSSEEISEIVQSFVSDSKCASDSKTKIEARKYTFKKENKQDQLLSKAREKQEVLAKSARFEQIWRSRRGSREMIQDEELSKMCRFYDVVRVDEKEKSEEMSEEDLKLLSSYLPMLKEFIPNAAVDVETDIEAFMSKQENAEEYVYDYYTMKEDVEMTAEEVSQFPLVQVGEDDYHDGPDYSDYETDDSNAEDNPMNDYPDEMSDEETETGESDNESEEHESQSGSDRSSKPNDFVHEEKADNYSSSYDGYSNTFGGYDSYDGEDL